MSEEMSAVAALLGMTSNSSHTDASQGSKRPADELGGNEDANGGEECDKAASKTAKSSKRAKSASTAGAAATATTKGQGSPGEEGKGKTGGRRTRKSRMSDEMHKYPVPPKIIQVCKVPKTHVDQ
jgi:hypothetical protein